MGRLLLVDTSIFVHLVLAGVIEDLAEIVGLKFEDIRRLGPVPTQMRRGEMGKSYNEEQREAVISLAERIPAIREQATSELTQRLIVVEDIDGGEATLLALVAEEPSCLLAIGDLRALRALSGADGLADVRMQLKGKILPMEGCLKLLLRAKGHTALARAFRPIRDSDRKLGVLFSDSNCANARQFEEALESYLSDLRSTVDTSILYEC